MEIAPRQKLYEIVTEYGRTICDEPKRLKGLLRDYCPKQVREVNILLLALEYKIPHNLLNSTQIPYELTASRLVKRLYDEVGMAEEFAHWAVDTWAMALGIIQTIPNCHPVVSQPEVRPPQLILPTQAAGEMIRQSFDFETVIVDAAGAIMRAESKQTHQMLENLGQGVTLEMVYIPGGTFLMGASFGEEGRYVTETPQHRVTLSAFYMSKYPITQAQWYTIMGDNPSHFRGSHRPVEQISWRECVTFCEKLSERTGRRYSLPSEAQWEYACRAGTTTPFYYGRNITTDLVNYNPCETYGKVLLGKYRQETTPVGSFRPNAWGLYDMHGNVWEWCQDAWRDNYTDAPTDGSAVEIRKNSHRVFRGGSWHSFPRWVRAASRYESSRDYCSNDLGLRIVAIL